MKGYLRVINQNIPTDIIDFVDLKVKAIKYRQEFAHRQGLEDSYVKKYDRTAAMQSLRKNDYHHFFVEVKGKRVGCVEVKIAPSSIDEQAVTILKTIYIEDSYRSYELFNKLVYEVQEMYPMRLEAECWYEQPELSYMKKFGFRNITSRLSLT